MYIIYLYIYTHTCVCVCVSLSVCVWSMVSSACGARRPEAIYCFLYAGKMCFSRVHERVSTKSFVVLIIGNSKLNHLGA